MSSLEISLSSLGVAQSYLSAFIGAEKNNNYVLYIAFATAFVAIFIPAILDIVAVFLNIILPAYRYFLVANYRHDFNAYFQILIVMFSIEYFLQINGTLIRILQLLYLVRLWYPNATYATEHWEYFLGLLRSLIDLFIAQLSAPSEPSKPSAHSNYVPIEEIFPFLLSLKVLEPILHFDSKLFLTISMYAGIVLGSQHLFFLNVVYYSFTLFLPIYLWWYPRRRYVTDPESKFTALFHTPTTHQVQFKSSSYWNEFFYIRVLFLVIVDGICGVSGVLPRAFQIILFFNLYFPQPTKHVHRVWDMGVKGNLSNVLHYLSLGVNFILFGTIHATLSPNATGSVDTASSTEKESSTISSKSVVHPIAREPSKVNSDDESAKHVPSDTRSVAEGKQDKLPEAKEGKNLSISLDDLKTTPGQGQSSEQRQSPKLTIEEMMEKLGKQQDSKWGAEKDRS